MSGLNRLVMAAFVLAILALAAQTCLGQLFSLTGYENLTGPGEAHLFLTTTPQEDWVNQTLRIEIAGPTVGLLLYPEVEAETDLGYFQLKAGDYTMDVYVLEKLGATVAQSGSSSAHEKIEFTVPKGPDPPKPDEPLLDPVNIGFMITALFIFGLVVAIWRSTKRPVIPADGQEQTSE